jgi:outer membrane receptor protein involved in Fe transport
MASSTSDAALETAVFTGWYDQLPTYEPFEPTLEGASGPAHVRAGLVAANLLHARMSGVELNARWNPLQAWEIAASFARLYLTAGVDAASLSPVAADTDGNAPEHQWEARTTVSLRPGVDVGASLWRIGTLRQLAIPAYTRLDARAQFRINSRLTAAVVGQNLSNRRHREFASDILFLTSSVPRAARIDLRWQF